jgi:hypothetical protein
MFSIINLKHLRSLEQINKYNLIKYSDIPTIQNILFDIKLNTNSNVLDLSYKFYFFIFLFSNLLSRISYKIIPTSSKVNTYLIKLESKITNGNKIDKFLQHFILEKKKLLRLNSVVKNIYFSNNIIILSITIPLKLYLQVNFISIKTVSILNYDNETIGLKFLLPLNRLSSLSNLISNLHLQHFFSFWNINIKR